MAAHTPSRPIRDATKGIDAAELPLVSILVPVYNGARYLRECLDSILAQTYPNIEVLVLDDASTDETAEIARGYADRIRHVRQPRNLGQFDNVNVGIAQARGDLITTYHADDIYLPTIVEASVTYLLSHPEVGATFCADIFVDADGVEYGRMVVPPEVRGEQPLDYQTVLNTLLTYKNRFLVCSSAMVRAAVYRDVGPYVAQPYGIGADLEMWLRIARRHAIAVLESHLVKYRHFHDNLSQQHHRLRTSPEEFFLILDEHLESCAAMPADPHALVNYEAHRAEDRLMAAVSCYIKGELPEGRQALRQVRLGVIRRASQVQRWRLCALAVAMWALLRLPRMEPLARAMYSRWHHKRPPTRRLQPFVLEPPEALALAVDGQTPRAMTAVAAIGGLQVVSMVLLLMRTKILAVMLGPAAVGTMSVIDRLIALIAQTLSLSLPFAALRFLPAALRESRAALDDLYRRMRTVLLVGIVPATVLCAAVSLLAPAAWGAELAPHSRTVALAFAGLPVVAFVPFLTNVYAGAMAHHRAMWFSVAYAVVLVVAALAAGAGFGLDGFYALYAVLGLMLVVMAAPRVIARIGSVGRLPLRTAFQLPSAVWRFAGALLALAFAAPYAALVVQYTTLRLYGADASGVLQSAIGISLSVRAVLGVAHAILLTPHVNREAEPAARMAWANHFQRTTVPLFVVVLPPLLLFPDVALRVLYSGRFVTASSFAALFIAAEVVALLSSTYQSLIVAGDRMMFHVAQNLAAQALLVVTALVALPRLGLLGAGVAGLAAPLFLFVTTIVFLSRQFAVHVSREAWVMAALTAGILVTCGAAGSRYPGLSLDVLGVKAVVCALTWTLAYAAMPSADRHQVRAGVRGLRDGLFRRAGLREHAA